MIVSVIRIQFAAAMALACICGFAPYAQAQAAPDYAALLAAPDRSDNDKQADQRRDPLPLLQFAGPRPGMKVLDMGAGGGYSTELMARAVAPNGKVYGQNPPDAFRQDESRVRGAAGDAGDERRRGRYTAVRRSRASRRATIST